MLGKNFSRQNFEIFSHFSHEIGFDISCKLFPTFGDNLHGISNLIFFWEKIEKYQFVISPLKKNINWSSAEFAHSILSVKILSVGIFLQQKDIFLDYRNACMDA